MVGAHLWHQIACYANLQYSFVGSFVARLNTFDNFTVHELEILVDPSALANDARTLNDIMYMFPEFLTVTPSNRHIIVIRENVGIAMRFFATGTEEYPDHFVPPPDSYFHNTEHVGRDQTYRGQTLSYFPPPYDIYVPVLRFDLLLRQRLLRFDAYSTDPDVQWQNQRDVNDIKNFLRCTFVYREPSFPAATAATLLPIVRDWIRYTRILCLPITHEEVDWLRRMRIPLTDADIVG